MVDTRQLVLFGAPALGVAALLLARRKPVVNPPGGLTLPVAAADTAALSDFSSELMGAFGQLQASINALEHHPAPITTPAPLPTPVPVPVPSSSGGLRFPSGLNALDALTHTGKPVQTGWSFTNGGAGLLASSREGFANAVAWSRANNYAGGISLTADLERSFGLR